MPVVKTETTSLKQVEFSSEYEDLAAKLRLHTEKQARKASTKISEGPFAVIVFRGHITVVGARIPTNAALRPLHDTDEDEFLLSSLRGIAEGHTSSQSLDLFVCGIPFMVRWSFFSDPRP
jgi:hypothetical protein